MPGRRVILAALTLARTAMGLQFQAVPAVAPLLVGELGLSYAALGTVIGLYLLPGAAFALPGGWLGQRFGDKRMALAGLGMMAAGGAALAAVEDPAATMAARAVSGVGAVLLNVMVTKMVGDWFAARNTVAAMGILIVSWPLGIALAMVLLPGLGAAAGWPAAQLAAAGAAAACLVLLAAVYRAPADAAAAARQAGRARLSRREATLATLAGLVWAFYNMAFITVVAFGPDVLIV